MKIEVGKTYETRGGRLARVICVDRKTSSGIDPIVALVKGSDGEEWCCTYRSDGVYGDNSYLNIIREYVPVTYRWYRVYKNEAIGNPFNPALPPIANQAGLIKLAFDPSGNLVIDKCEITGAQPNG